jgi:hypothetical protein
MRESKRREEGVHQIDAHFPNIQHIKTDPQQRTRMGNSPLPPVSDARIDKCAKKLRRMLILAFSLS